MSSETPEVQRLTSAGAKAVIIPRIPQDLMDEIPSHLAPDSDLRSLQACALVSRSWAQSCRRRLFHTISFASRDMDKWLMKTFPVPEESPARYVRDLHVGIGWSDPVPDKFFECTPQFTNVERISLLGHMAPPSSLRPSSWKLPRFITSLTVNASVFTLVQVRDVMTQLPNLNDLTLMGSFVKVDRRELPGIGKVVKGRFGGKLKLCGEYAGEDAANMLLEIPSGLHFTEVLIHHTPDYLPSAVRLAEACCKTVVKLSYPVVFSGEPHFLSQSNEIPALTPFSGRCPQKLRAVL